MSMMSNRDRGFALVLIVLSVAGLVFQNCSNSKFLSQSLADGNMAAPNLAESQPPPGESETAALLDCEIPTLPYKKLSETCLSKAMAKISKFGPQENFFEFEPRYPLYSDDATKQRWIYLPPGTKINSTSPDEWEFPKGTILFKLFSKDDIAVEIRMMEKVEAAKGYPSWRFSIFLKRKNDSDFDRLDDFDLASKPDIIANYEASRVINTYKVGSVNQCATCHATAPDSVRGFSYFQLSHIDQNKLGNINFLVGKNLLTKVPNRLDDIIGNSLQKQAVGYIQSNCATCHDGKGQGPGDFRHLSTSTNFSDEPFYKTMMTSSGLVVPGNAANSRFYQRMSNGTMPKIPLVNKDTQAIEQIKSWIDQFQN